MQPPDERPPLDRVVQVRVDEVIYARLRAIADAERTTVSAVARRMLLRALDDEERRAGR